MSKKLRVKVKRPWIAYPGTPIQQNFAEDVVHGYLQWDIESRSQFAVKFRELPNPKPFVTIEWDKDVESTVAYALANVPPKCRVRVRVKQHISQNEAQKLTSELRAKLDATEVVFKTDAVVQKSSLQTGQVTIQRDDLRNPEMLVKLLKEYHTDASVTVSDEEWDAVFEQLKSYLADPALNEDILRNVKWSLRRLSFDNTFAYGQGNVIDFQSLSGIVGIFGPNRAGKSSIVGTMMYALFNGTDRGTIKNIHVVNVRKSYCTTNAIVNVGGIDYVIERQTSKNENKRGQVNASTALNVFRVNNVDNIEDLAGEQRNDTEKIVKRLIGGPEDFLMTSLSAQDDINQFIKHGSSKRAQFMSRFIDLDVFAKIHELANKDANALKAQLKMFATFDDSLVNRKKIELEGIEQTLIDVSERAEMLRDELTLLQQQVALSRDTAMVTRAQVEAQKKRVLQIEESIRVAESVISEHGEKVKKLKAKLEKIAVLKHEHDLSDLRSRLGALQTLESNVVALKHQHERESSVHESQKKSLKILDEVPCGDSFPTCKFIKDAHENKDLVDKQKTKVDELHLRLDDMMKNLKTLKTEKLGDRVKQVEQIYDLETKIKLDISACNVDLVKSETILSSSRNELSEARSKLAELERAFYNDENAEVASLRTRIAKLMEQVKHADSEKVRLASLRGKVTSDIEKYDAEIVRRDEITMKLKFHELISTAFSKKALPTIIINSQLPLINSEIAKILHGIVDYSVELEVDASSDSLEVYINYGDSRRIIELGSGMEKMIASIAIRVALINISTLPKTDMFIIDEGFGALDEAGVESCNRLLTSLKRYFRLVLVITHVDGIKDSVDHFLEIVKHEKDSSVNYVGS